MIRHCVMLNLAAGYDPSQLSDVMAGLRDVAEQLSGCSGFVCGPNRDFEAKSPDYPYGFTLDFKDASALRQYAENPQHKALGTRLVRLCTGGAAGILVFDLELQERSTQ
ncbi:Dabb family protein [Ruegeria atlantica]|uniref:Dabb family protein n=1 Tax=Ruegeria atlantica TaxID=81569 RepID=UPI00147FA031|nr:Dabb family protein [Ruegeria atlantica]